MPKQHDALPSAFALGTVSYYLDFALAPLASLGLLVTAFATGLALLLMAVYAAVGVIGWTLAEYLIHRFAFHYLPLLRPMHDVHHAHPKDYVGIASYGVFAAVVLVLGGLAVLIGFAAACAVTAGVLLGYLFYIAVHDRYHHGDRTRFGRYVRFMERYHAGHHRGGETNFGVSSPFWDIVFGTRR